MLPLGAEMIRDGNDRLDAARPHVPDNVDATVLKQTYFVIARQRMRPLKIHGLKSPAGYGSFSASRNHFERWLLFIRNAIPGRLIPFRIAMARMLMSEWCYEENSKRRE